MWTRRPARINKELLDKNRKGKPTEGGSQVTRKEYWQILPATRDQVRTTKALKELNLPRDHKNNSKTFYRYISGKRKTRENVGPLQKETGELVTQDMEKVEVLNDFFCLSLHWQVLQLHHLSCRRQR